jgi:hypothetical protein
MKSVEIVLRRGEGGKGRTMEGVNLGYVISTYVNITMYPHTTITCQYFLMLG